MTSQLKLPTTGIKTEGGDSSSVLSASLPEPGPSVPGATTVVNTDSMDESPAVKFLREKLASRNGYPAFIANRGHVLANPEIVKVWRFAVEFSNEYNKVKHPVVSSVSVLILCNLTMSYGRK